MIRNNKNIGDVSIADEYFSPPSPEIDRSMGDSIIRNIRENIERDIHGAWRAGYDFLHIYRSKIHCGKHDMELEDTILKIYTYPSNRKTPPDVEGLNYKYTHDLKSVDNCRILEAINSEF